MKKEEKNCWIKFVPSLDLPKERVSIAYDTHDERRVRYAYGYFQFHGGTCTMFWKDGNEQPKSVKAADILYWMPIPSFDSIRDEPKLTSIERNGKEWKEAYRLWCLSHEDGDVLYCVEAWKAAMDWQKQQMMKEAIPRKVKFLDSISYNHCIAHLGMSEEDTVKLILVKEG